MMCHPETTNVLALWCVRDAARSNLGQKAAWCKQHPSRRSWASLPALYFALTLCDGSTQHALQRQKDFTLSPTRFHCLTAAKPCREQKAAQRDRAALVRSVLHRPDPLLRHITDRLLDRLEDCVAKFPTAVILGGAGEVVAEGLAGGRAGLQRVIHIDTSSAMLQLAKVG